jgi:hypothetical protein
MLKECGCLKEAKKHFLKAKITLQNYNDIQK